MKVIWWSVGVMAICVGVLVYVVVTARMNEPEGGGVDGGEDTD